jgi:UDP-glucose 4-epimerase
MLLASRKAQVKRFVYVSSSEVYGTARSVPMTEQHPAFPLTVYGASKLAGECYTRAFHETYGLGTVIIRPFNAYGPRCHHEGDSGEVIPKFMLRCMAGRDMVVFGNGTQTRDFTYVADTAGAILQAGLVDQAVGKTVNVGSGQEICIADLAREVAAAVGNTEAHIRHDHPRPGDVLRLCADPRTACELLGFQARVTLAEGLGLLRDWYLAQRTEPEVLLQRETVHNWLTAGARSDV